MPQEKWGEALVSYFIDAREGPNAGDQLNALLRAAASHEVARERYVDLLTSQVGAEVRSVIPEDQFERRFRLIINQLVGLGFCRYVLRHPLIATLDREAIIQQVGMAVQNYLTQ